MAEITTDSYKESNLFTKVIFQRGRDVRDSELNEFQDIVRVFLYRTMLNGLQATKGGASQLNPGSNDNGYKVVGTGATNSVTVKAGTIFCDGIPITLATDMTLPGFSTPGSDRTDTVYLSVTEQEVNDPSATTQLGSTTLRRQLVVSLQISTTGHAGVPSNAPGSIYQGSTHYFIIADIARHSGSGVISSGDVTDQRGVLAPSVIASITTVANGAVASLVGSLFETADGTQIAKSNHMVFDVDPDASQTDDYFEFQRHGRSSAISMAKIMVIDSGDVTYAAGARTAVQRPENPGSTALIGTIDDFRNSSGGFTNNDLLSAQAGGTTHSGAVFRYSSQVLANDGDNIIRVMDIGSVKQSGVSTGVPSPSMFKLFNSRWAATCGDGNLTFGEFNGPQAVQNAIDFYMNHVVPSLGDVGMLLLLKGGAFDLTGTARTVGTASALNACTIRGIGMDSTVVAVDTGSTNSFVVPTGSTLRIEDLTLAGTGSGAISVVGALRLKNVRMTGHSVLFTNNVTPNGAPSLLAHGCTFDMTTGSDSPVKILAGDGATHEQFIFYDCQFLGATAKPILLVKNSGNTAGTIVRRVEFVDCTMKMLSSGDNGSGTLTGNCGVLEFDPTGANNTLTLDAVLWDRCYVTANYNGAGTNAILALIVPCPRGSGASPTQVGYIGKLTIRGGVWTAVSKSDNSGTVISSFLVASNSMVIEDTRFIGTGYSSGRPPVESTYVINGSGGSAIATTDWDAFTIATGGKGVSALPQTGAEAGSLSIRNISFTNFYRLSNSGDLGLWLPFHANVTGIRVNGYVSSGPGSVPNHRVQVQGNLSSGSGTTGMVENMRVIGVDSAATTWTAITQDHGCFIVQPNGGLHMKRCVVGTFTTSAAASQMDGFVMVNGTTGTQYSLACYGLTLEDCESSYFNNGFACLNTANTATQVVGLKIRGGTWANCAAYGIYFRGYDMYDLHVDGAIVKGNASSGIYVHPILWLGGVRLSNNRCYNNATGGVNSQIEILGDTGKTPVGSAYGNDLSDPLNPAAQGILHFTQNNAGINGTNEANHATIKFRGIETDYTASSISVAHCLYTSGDLMHHNNGTLISV